MTDGKRFEEVLKLYQKCEEAKKKRINNLPEVFRKSALEHYEKYVEEKKKLYNKVLKILMERN